MKLYHKIGLFFLVSVVLGALYVVYKKQYTHKASRYKIAIFEPASHPAMDEIAEGFMNTIKKSYQGYHFDIYNANGNSTLLRAQAEEIIHQRYDLIMSIGADTTRTLHELTSKKGIATPIVFSAVSNPVQLGVVASLVSSKNNVTGVEDAPRFAEQINRLLAVKPETKSVLLVYDPVIKGGAHERNAAEVNDILHAQQREVAYAPVFHANEIHAKVQPLIENHDVIMIFTDHTTVSGLDSLIVLCNRYHKTLYASDLNSGKRGAALSFGVTEYDYGSEAARLAIDILENNKNPQDIPIASVRNFKVQINTKVMSQQGLNLSPEQLRAIEQEGGIII